MASRLETLLTKRGQHALTGLPLGPLPAYLAVDAAGHPALAVPAVPGGRPHVIETEYLALRLFTQATLTQVDGTKTDGSFHLFCCKRSSPEVISPFEALATALAEGLDTVENSDAQLYEAFETLCELFRTKPASDVARARIGLWGELFLMREMGGYGLLAPFWHTEPRRKFDFSCGSHRLEVKTTTGPERSHTFSHAQLYSPGDYDIVISSLRLSYEDAGLSLGDLISEVRTALAQDHSSLLKLEKAVRAAGMAETGDRGPTFGLSEARLQLAFYKAEDVPHFDMAEPEGVSGTTYTASLSGSTPMSSAETQDWLTKWHQPPA